MDKDIQEASSSGMGLEDPTAACLDAQFANITKSILALLDDTPLPEVFQPPFQRQLPLPPPQHLVDKYNYFLKLRTSINEAKLNFEHVYNVLNQRIEELCEQLRICVNARQQELKHHLWCIKAEKISTWQNQLKIIGEMLQQLRGPSTSRTAQSLADREALDFVDSGELKLEIDNFNLIFNNIQNFGKFISPKGSCKWKDNKTTTPTPKFVFGAPGDGPSQFCRPWGVCCDYLGRIIVCDRSNHRIQIFDEHGEFVTKFGKEGQLPGEFYRPSGVHVNNEGHIIVADKDNHRVQVFTNSGHFIFLFGSEGSRPGQFLYPWDVSTNSQCCIAVSDSKNHRVQLFTKKGRLMSIFDAKVMRIENPRKMLKHLDSPRGVSFLPDDNLLVTDFNNHKIIRIRPDFKRMSVFGSEGAGPGQFYRPQGIACDRSGKIAVSDSKNYRIQVIDQQGNVLRIFGSQGSMPGQFDCPQGVCFHPNNSIVVVDFSNNRVQIF